MRWKQVGWEEKERSWKTKRQMRREADLICNSQVAWDYMRGLTRSARGTDGPTQQNLCTHVWIQNSFFLEQYLFIYLPVHLLTCDLLI